MRFRESLSRVCAFDESAAIKCLDSQAFSDPSRKYRQNNHHIFYSFLSFIQHKLLFTSTIRMLQMLKKNGILFKINYVTQSFSNGAFASVRRQADPGRIEVAALTSKGETTARKILQKALNAGLLVSDTPKGPVRLAFPAKVLNHYFPGLYVEGI